uniref:Uncharacterized protein n=1 Tax=Anopheles christyi TaxID=43041 RepID=A0A182KH24_9DIPT
MESLRAVQQRKRSVSADNQYEAEREGLSEIIATPRYLEFLKNYREEAAATAASDATLAASSPRYIEVRKGRIVLESSHQQQPPPLPIRNGTALLPDGEKTDLQHQQPIHHGRDSVLRINREKVPAGCPMVPSTLSDGGYENDASTPLPPLPPSPPCSPTACQGYSPNSSSPVHECGKLVRNTSGSVSDSCKNTSVKKMNALGCVGLDFWSYPNDDADDLIPFALRSRSQSKDGNRSCHKYWAPAVCPASLPRRLFGCFQ